MNTYSPSGSRSGANGGAGGSSSHIGPRFKIVLTNGEVIIGEVGNTLSIGGVSVFAFRAPTSRTSRFINSVHVISFEPVDDVV